MKKILLSIPLLFVVLFVSGNDIKYDTPGSCAKEVLPEAHEILTAANKELMECMLANTDLQSESIAVLLSGGDSIKTVAVHRPRKPKRESLAPALPVDSLEDYILPNLPFKSYVMRHAGRDRYGAYTEECAAYVNGCLKKIGIYSTGHSYQIPARFKVVLNGYASQKLPNIQGLSYSEAFLKVIELHRKAADYIKANLDVNKLDPDKYYIVNMYYSTSQYMVQFYNESRWNKTNNHATHVGIVYYDRKAQAWVVDHNIHGHVHRDALVSVLGGRSNPQKYGVTTIYQVVKKN